MTAHSGRNALGPYGVVYRSAIERIPKGDTTAVALFALLVTYAHDGAAWPAQATQAEVLGVSEGTVRRAIETLCKAGVIAKEPRLDHGRKIGNTYVILAPDGTRTHARSAERAPMRATERAPMRVPNPMEQSLEHTAATPRVSRQRDLLFDAVCEVCSLDVNCLTKSEAGRVGRACAELRQLDPQPSPDDVRAFGRTWQRQAPGFDLTPNAVTGNWHRIMRADEMSRRRERQRRNDQGVA